MRYRLFHLLYPLLLALWKQRYLVVVPMILLPILALLIHSSMEKKYYSHTTILVQESALINPFLEDISISYNLKERIEALRVLLHSRSVLSDVIDELELVDAANRAQYDAMLNRLSQNLTLELAGSDLIRLSLTWHEPVQMPHILEQASAQFLYRLQAPGRASLDSSENFLKDQLERRQQDLVLAETQLARFKTSNANILPLLEQGLGFSEQQIRKQMRETELKLVHAQSEYDSLSKQLTQSSPVVSMLEEEVVKAEAELAILRASYTDQHSSVQAVLRRLSQLKIERDKLLNQRQQLNQQNIAQLWQLATSLSQSDNERPALLQSQLEQLQQAEVKLSGLKQERALLAQKGKELAQQVVELAELEKQLAVLQRNYDVQSRLYDQLLERYEMARVTGQLGRFEEPEKLKVIDRPYQPQTPQQLSLFIVLALSCIGGLGVGLMLATVAEIFDSRVYHNEQITHLAPLPILARIPKLKDQTEEPI
ncbi:hypothetical protein VST7929_02442 [Vibrio stylophorae]|uniref:Chain-length determining protein n=1 Tax=Vibrio stylophorae TaxID=659351 RepID=A0ABM8ZVX6_9VIBR|nr:Wzz/FepE/Etk N-terminal domain-containing protein [Vibrio stylophorae]CAH0534499.1 hypothetical protein VST7929_02442 [Vibrio stylophorae]